MIGVLWMSGPVRLHRALPAQVRRGGGGSSSSSSGGGSSSSSSQLVMYSTSSSDTSYPTPHSTSCCSRSS